jgi:hypothetical protein
MWGQCSVNGCQHDHFEQQMLQRELLAFIKQLIVVALKRNASNLPHAPMPQAQEGVFDFGRSHGSKDVHDAEIQELRKEIAEMQMKDVPANPPPPLDPLFPANSLAEIVMSRLKTVERRETTRELCSTTPCSLSPFAPVCVTSLSFILRQLPKSASPPLHKVSIMSSTRTKFWCRIDFEMAPKI